jgi:hypothetical protein
MTDIGCPTKLFRAAPIHPLAWSIGDPFMPSLVFTTASVAQNKLGVCATVHNYIK